MKNDPLFDRYLRNELTAEECRELKRRLREEPETAREFAAHVNDTGLMVRVAGQLEMAGEAPRPAAWRPMRWLMPLAAAAVLLVAVGAWWQAARGGRQAAGGEVVARVTEVASGKWQAAGGNQNELRVGDAIRDGTKIETGADGRVKLAWANQPTTVEVGERSVLNVQGPGKSQQLEQGQLVARVAKQAPGQPFEVETPLARVTVVGTKFTVWMGLSESGVSVSEGLVKVLALGSGQTAMVAPGSRCTVQKDGSIRTGPLAGLPGPERAHMAKIRALGDRAWLNLGRPAPDPTYGMPKGRGWSRKMAFASDLRGAFLFGSTAAGGNSTVRDGCRYYNDDLFFYDIQANAWICCHPGTLLNNKGLPDSGIRLDPATGLNVDPAGRILPVSTSIHAFWTPEYDMDRRTFMFMPSTDPMGFQVTGGWTQSSDAWSNKYSPYYYDGITGRFERRLAASPSPVPGLNTAVFYSPGQKKAVYFRDGVWFYDHAANSWQKVNNEGGGNAAYCYDSKRDQVYVVAADHKAGFKNRLTVFDIPSRQWIKVAATGDAGTTMESRDGFFTYDAVNDVAIVYLNDRQYVYDPNARSWTALPATASEPLRPGGSSIFYGGSAFYDPELNAHFYFSALDGNTGPGNMWVYRYAAADAGRKE